MSLAVQIAGHGFDGDPLKAILKRKFCKSILKHSKIVKCFYRLRANPYHILL